ncbi:MICOS complex subunit MIC13 homolog QIL1 isoform X2 [Malaya genurostris]|uniref:MICOS complex subunit MIC13 homolog QIL1 isoform X2 n=1 Tax=Malaya genurostris TaxID=325434 RepID=UPI0026F38F67|nr:MICOS complex subunit MIC13 homolog QIL1 isoform X2 [Malaya genurostris]
MLKILIKTGLAGSAVYYTRNEGIWNENTDKVYERYSSAMQPHIASVPALPKSGELCFLTTHYYNAGVKNTIYFIHRLPCYLGQWTKQTSDAIKKAINPPTEASPTTPTAVAGSKK